MNVRRLGFDGVIDERKNSNDIWYSVLAACNTYIFYLGIIFLIAILLSIPVTAKVMDNSTLELIKITDSSLSFGYNSSTNFTKASFDGVIINFDNQSLNYTADDLTSTSYHTFCVYSEGEINCEGGITQIKQESDKSLIGLIYNYIWWIIAVILLVCAVWLKSRMIGFISAISCLIGMVRGITDSSFIVFMLYVVTFIGAYLISEDLKTG